MIRVVGGQFRYGLRSHEGTREGPARKGTGFLTNSFRIAKQLTYNCSNGSGSLVHQRVRLQNGRTRAAQEYPDGLRRAMCKGMRDQFEAGKDGRFLLMVISANEIDKLLTFRDSRRPLRF